MTNDVQTGPGAYQVHPNAFLDELQRLHPRERLNGALGGGVIEQHLVALVGIRQRGIDDGRAFLQVVQDHARDTKYSKV